MRARYYSPELKKFINADVVKGEIGKSNTLNRYAYVEGNPATLIDPFGLSAEPGTKSNKSSFNWSEGIHTALDAGGFIPGLGNICDGINAIYYLIQGDFSNAGLSAISIIPFGDYFAKGGKYTVKIGSNLAEAGIKHGDDVVKGVRKVDFFVAPTGEIATTLREIDLYKMAESARDIMIETTPGAKKKAVAIGAYDLKTGNVVADFAGTIPDNINMQLINKANEIGGVGSKGVNGKNVVGACAEFRSSNQLLNSGSNLDDIRFTIAVRPRNGKVVPRCTNCQSMFK